MERNKRERTSIKASSHWPRFGLPPILSWTSCKWAFGHSGWAVKWAPHETCCPLHHIMLGIDTEVPCFHWPHSPVSYIWMEFVYALIIYRCAQGECVRTNCAVNARLYLQENWEWIVCTLKWVAENYIMCLSVLGKEYYVCFSGCSLKENVSKEVPFLCWSQTSPFVLFGMVCNIFVCLKKHLLFQDSSSYHIHVKVIGLYVGKSNISALKKMQRWNHAKRLCW